MWGIVPAAGSGARFRPLAFSKELLPIGGRAGEDGERPKAVCEYLLDRMIAAGARKIALVVSPGKSDIVEYFGGSYRGASLCYLVQEEPRGLCDAIFRALSLVRDDEPAVVGLPDTVWFPEDGLRKLPDVGLSFLLFPVQRPELFDAVVHDHQGRVLEIQVKQPHAVTPWIWGAFRLDGAILRQLHELWLERNAADPHLGTLVNAWMARGGHARAVRAGTAYVDVGTLHGYREAVAALGGRG